MIELKTLLGRDKRIIFYVKKPFYQRFLKYAKANDCSWINGKKILPNKDNCEIFMGINNHLHLGFVPYSCYFLKKDKLRCIKFNQKFIKGEYYETINN